MDIGSLRKRLSFQQLGGTPDTFGNIETWVTYYTCFGSCKQLASQLIYGAGQFVGKETYDIRIRYTSTQTFSIGDRCLTEDGTIFNIDSVINVQMRNRELSLLGHVINQVV